MQKNAKKYEFLHIFSSCGFAAAGCVKVVPALCGRMGNMSTDSSTMHKKFEGTAEQRQQQQQQQQQQGLFFSFFLT